MMHIWKSPNQQNTDTWIHGHMDECVWSRMKWWTFTVLSEYLPVSGFPFLVSDAKKSFCTFFALTNPFSQRLPLQRYLTNNWQNIGCMQLHFIASRVHAVDGHIPALFLQLNLTLLCRVCFSWEKQTSLCNIWKYNILQLYYAISLSKLLRQVNSIYRMIILCNYYINTQQGEKQTKTGSRSWLLSIKRESNQMCWLLHFLITKLKSLWLLLLNWNCNAAILTKYYFCLFRASTCEKYNILH